MKKLFLFSAIILAMSFQSCESWSGCGVIQDINVGYTDYGLYYEFVVEDDMGERHTVKVSQADYYKYYVGDAICF